MFILIICQVIDVDILVFNFRPYNNI